MADQYTVGVTAGSAFDLAVEEAVFEGLDVAFRPVDVETTDDLRRELVGVDAVLDRLLTAPYTAEVIAALDGCRAIARCGIGVDHVDLDAATDAGMYVLNVPDYCLEEVSTHALMLALALERDLRRYDASLREGVWEKRLGEARVRRLSTMTVGLVGFGAIARRVADKFRAFGADVVATDPYVDADEMETAGVEKVEFEPLLDRAHVVSVHTPLLDETRGMFDADAFARMREDAYFLNVARGGLHDEAALDAALDSGDIAGAGIDVFADEPADRFDGTTPSFETPLARHENVVLTPHVAWYSGAASDEKRRTAAEGIRAVFEGREPEHAAATPE
ncbi:C-terminal binding protein [Halobium salinum]|uniref:C-terminal binding protein n=1 Tax=Halobium salinum TaxID=1364940 RepID=A0ABD5PHN9_9EURY|nr:C-terminal binding protein [Halobium salinum]